MNILRHLLLLSSTGLVGGWLMVERGIAGSFLIASSVVIAALYSLYFGLLGIHWFLRPLRKQLYDSSVESSIVSDSVRYPGRAFDLRGRLQIHRSSATER